MSTLNLSWLTTFSGGGLSLLTSLLTAMKSLRDATTQTVEWHDALDVLRGALECGTKPDGVPGDVWNVLVADWAQLKATLRDQLPAALRPLTFKLSDIATASFAPAGKTAPLGLITYPLLVSSAASAGTPTVGGLAFKTSASVATNPSIDIQVSEAAPDWATAVGYTLPDGEYLVSFGISGELTATASASATPTWGSISATAGAHAGAFFHDCFTYPPSRYLADVLLNSLPSMYAPGDLGGLLNACSGSDFALRDIELSGGLSFSGTLDVGAALVSQVGSAAANWTAVPLGPPATANLGVSASVGFNWGQDGDFRVLSRRVAGGAAVRIDRNTSRTAGATLSISASLDIQGLQAMLDPVMTLVMPSAQPIIDKLGELADLRGIARSTLVARLGLSGTSTWDAIGSALVDVATGGSASAATGAIGNIVGQRLDDLAKAYLLVQSADLTPYLQDVTSAVQQVLPPGLGIGPKLAGVLQDVETNLQQRIDDAWTKFSSNLADQAGAALVQAVAGPGQQVGAFITALQGRLNTATAPFVKWLNAYEAARTRVANAIAQVEREKLAISWAYTYKQQRDSTTLVEVRFVKATPLASALHRAICVGRLDDYANLLTRCSAEGSAFEIESLFGESLTRTRTANFTLDAFGFLSLAATATQLDQVAVAADRTGRIVAASDHIVLDQKLSAKGKVTDATLTLGLEMLALPGGMPTLSSVFSASGDSFTAQDSVTFFQLLEQAGAVSRGTGQRVHDLLWAGSPGQAAALANAELSAIYAPDTAAWPRLLALDAPTVEAATRSQCLHLLDLAITTGAERDNVSGHPADWVAEWMNETGMSDAEFWQSSLGGGWIDWYNRLLARSGSSASQAAIGVGRSPPQSAIRLLWILQHLSAGVGRAWAGVSDAQALLQQLAANPNALTRDQALSRLADLSEAVVSGFGAAFPFELADPSQPTKTSWMALGPILALASFASTDDAPPLVTKVVAKVAGQDIAQLVV